MDLCVLGCFLDAAQLLVNRTRRIVRKTFVIFRKIAENSPRLCVLQYTTQLSYTFHNVFCTFVTPFFGLLFGCS